jgi:DNA mismatch repair ATPase MutS
MEIDKTTLNDLNIFNGENNLSLFGKINFTNTTNGEAQLKLFLSTPLKNIEEIKAVQDTLKHIIPLQEKWPNQISNGTIKVIERFYETNLSPIPENASFYHAKLYLILQKADFSLLKFSVNHCFDFIKGLKSIIHLLSNLETPALLKNALQDIEKLTAKNAFDIIDKNEQFNQLSVKEIMQLGYYFRNQYKSSMLDLLKLHAKIDAWFGMSKSVKEHQLSFPVFVERERPFFNTKGLHHLILNNPTPYDFSLDQQQHFLFLTGANMAGKSTFIKSVGSAVFLAHTGMAVPAQTMELSIFDGMLSNINIMDDLSKGESYFYNEVQRIKTSIQKINDGKKWLVLIDELFKGTNVEDAMKCSTIVIEGLVKIPNALCILSTHLYEISESLKKHNSIKFNYFETAFKDDQFQFSYALKEGVSNDRIGYLILKKEGVIQMLEDLSNK